MKKKQEEEKLQKTQVISYPKYNKDKFNEWTKKNSNWKKNKNEKINSLKTENEFVESQYLKSLHHPSIDKKSEYLVKSKDLNRDFVEPVHERLYNIKDDKYSKIERKVAESIPSFSPYLFDSKYSPESKYKRYFRNNNTQLKCNSIDSIRINAYNSVEERPKSPRYNRKGTFESRFRAGSEVSQESIHLEEKKGKKHKSNYECRVPWQNLIDKASTRRKNSFDKGNSLYKINVRDNSSWHKEKSNEIMYNPKFLSLIGKVNEQV